MNDFIKIHTYRRGISTGIYNRENPRTPEWESLPKDEFAVKGYNFGYNNVEEARKALKEYWEWEQWQ